jgi:hypothetical protein
VDKRERERALQELAIERARINGRLETAVQLARLDGCSWERIGASLSITRQAAWEQYRWLEDQPLPGHTLAGE